MLNKRFHGQTSLMVVFCLAVVGTAPRAASGSDAPARRDVSQLLAPIVTRHKLPGMVAAVVRGKGLVAHGASGVRRNGSTAKVTADDKFHIGSCTKSMTASLCAMLVEDNKLSWTSDLQAVFPELKSEMRSQYHSITLEQLLRNRGGVTTDLKRDGLWARLWSHKGTPTQARRALLQGVVRFPLAATPGDKYIYSNAGFAIAGHMAETVTGSPWEELMRRRIFEPLDMQSAGFGAPGAKEKLNQPRGHSAKGEPVEPGPRSDNPVAIGPAGIVHCSIEDWGKYISWHLRGTRGKAKLLKPESFATLHQPAGSSPQYAMGWVATDRKWGQGRVLTHSGSNTMWFAVTWLAPKRDFAVLVACNQGGEAAKQACDEAASKLITDYLANMDKGR